ncbi:MAG: magnesium/cobalt transporter CorA [Bacteroidia bacterium]
MQDVISPLPYSLHKRKRSKPGAAPGSLHIPETSVKPIITHYLYRGDDFEKRVVSSVAESHKLVEDKPDLYHWIDIRGYGDIKVFEDLKLFHIHKLELEDVLNVYQRPKNEPFENHVFLISRMMYLKKDVLINEQLSIFLGNNFLITVQEYYEDVLDPVRKRLTDGKGNIRIKGSGYLAYALMDAVIDHYYPVLEGMGVQLDELEDKLIRNPKREDLEELLQIKRELIILRRAIWPERDKINDLLRSSSVYISDEVKVFLRDSYDHCIQVLDLVESFKEMTASLMDIYLSGLSNRMNQIMKVLAVIATIFIPLTFVAGIYGMNFVREHPETGEIMPMNMPELYSPYGYVGVWMVMILIILIQLFIFYRKGWLGKD